MSRRARRIIEVNRYSVLRPTHAPLSYVCPACDVVLYDGTDYLWCPACSSPVDWVDLDKPLWCCASCDAFVNAVCDDWPRCAACDAAMARVHAIESPPPPASEPVSTGAVATAIGGSVGAVLLVVKVVVLASHPLGFALLAPLLLVVVAGAATLVFALVVSLGPLHALAADQRTRCIHGLEHACIKLLERQGWVVFGGQTDEGCFALEVFNDGRSSDDGVQRAAAEAAARIVGGESSLAYDRRCGTSLLAALALVALVILGGAAVGLVSGVQPGLIAVITAVAALGAWLCARPLGLVAQRALTVSTRFASARVVRVVHEVQPSGNAITYVVFVDVQLPSPRLTTTRAAAT